MNDVLKNVELLKRQMEQQDRFYKECQRICELGIRAEQKGDIENAIKAYEDLLSHGFDGTHPYRALCEIYHKQKRTNDEIRVINRLREVTPKERYKESDKYRWYDKRYKELV